MKVALYEVPGDVFSEPIRNRRATPPPDHFNATLRATVGWLFFGVARSLRINLDMLVDLKNS